jgi:ABC-type amino acid transport substrate-binding protein
MSRLARHVIAFVVLAAAVAGAASAQAPADTLARVKQSGAIRLGFLQLGIPFAYLDRDGKPAGYSVDLCSRVAAGIARQLGTGALATTWVPLEPAERLDAVKSGKVDIECGLTTTSLSRMKEVDFSLPIFMDGGTVLVKAGTPYARLADLAGKRIAVLAGTTTIPRIEEASRKGFLNLKLVEVKERDEGLAKVRSGEVDGLAGDRTNLIAITLASGSAEAFSIIGDDFSYEPYGLVVRRNDADFRLAVNRVLAELYRSGQILEVFDRTFGRVAKPSTILQAMFILNSLPE